MEKEKVSYIGSVVHGNRMLYETNDKFKRHVEEELCERLGNFIVKNKNILPVNFTEIEPLNRYIDDTDNITLRVDVLIVDRNLKRVIDAIVDEKGMSEIMYEIQRYYDLCYRGSR